MRKRSLRWGLLATAAVGVTGALAAAVIPWSADADTSGEVDGWKVAYGSPDLGGQFLSVAVADDTHAWAFGNSDAGGDGDALIQRWNGAKWAPEKIADKYHTSPKFADAASVDDVWAGAPLNNAGDAFVLLHNDGSQWSETKLDVPNVNDIQAAGSGEVLLLGDGLTRFDGKTTTEEPAPKYAHSGLEAVSGKEMYAVGTHDDQPFAEKWDGEKWASMNLPEVDLGDCSAAGLDDVYARASDDVWAVGSYTCGDNSKPLVSHWNGSKWEQIDYNTHPGKFTQVADDGDGGIWIADQTGNYVHRDADGTFTRYPAGVEDDPDATPLAASIGNVPGTRSMIGTAWLYQQGETGDLHRYGIIRQYEP